jgi:aminoglycoside phosphotransferase (APT) family kinase protein
MTTNRTLPHETIAAIVQQIEPTWTVEESTVEPAGHHITYFLTVETPTGTEQCVLKATPEEEDPVCDDESRMLAIIDAHTGLPVPEVLGVIDEDDALPTPLFLAAELPGINENRTALSTFPASQIDELARSTGRHLAALHDLDAVEGFGFVDIDPDERLQGGKPSSSLDQISVADPVDTWRGYLDHEYDRMLDRFDGHRFEDMVPTIQPAFETCTEVLGGKQDPVITRIDQSLDNQVLDPATGAVTGLLDWEFCVAATPAYDIAFVVDSLAGGHLPYLPNEPDHREQILTGVLAGYCEAGGEAVVERFRANRACYELLSLTHKLLNFEFWFDAMDIVDVTDEQRSAAADALRERITAVAEAVEDG